MLSAHGPKQSMFALTFAVVSVVGNASVSTAGHTPDKSNFS